MKNEKRITRATIKSFINKNAGDIYINVKSSFDGMIDGCRDYHDGFKKAEKSDDYAKYNLGISGAWFVGQSRDYFEAFSNDNYEGYKVYNSCGGFYLAIKK